MKFTLIAVLAVCVVGSMGAKYCSYEDAEDVLSNWNSMMDGGNTAPYMLAIFREAFKKIYAREPESRELFKRVMVSDTKSPVYQAHVLRVANAFDDVLNKLNSHQVMDQMIDHLSKAHAGRVGMKKQHFEMLAEELEVILEVILDNYNPDAWKNCLSGILNGISSSLV